jgi:hypothetical protein
VEEDLIAAGNAHLLRSTCDTWLTFSVCVCSLKKVISEHFESEINKLPRFLSWQVRPSFWPHK